MDIQDAVATLRRHEGALHARGVAHAAVFGSVARGENRPDSDVDILVDFEPGRKERSTITCASKSMWPVFSTDRLM
jgi:predicted nucleotidyltransferase